MKRKIFVCAFIFALAFVGVSYAEIISGSGIAVVEVDGGKLQGYIRNNIFTYHGVPYAEAELFMPPTKLQLGATMIIDDEPEITYHHDNELMQLLIPIHRTIRSNRQ